MFVVYVWVEPKLCGDPSKDGFGPAYLTLAREHRAFLVRERALGSDLNGVQPHYALQHRAQVWRAIPTAWGLGASMIKCCSRNDNNILL
eukprot:2925005-Amphidinium_carterae.1